MKGFCLEVWGDFACFTRPELKTERMSYDVPTPSAVRAFFEAIFWKPAISWRVRKIEVLEPIRFISVRRNEVASKAGERSEGIFIEKDRQQRAGLFLRDVKYRFYAEFDYIKPEDRPPVIRPTDNWLYDAEEKLLYEQAEALKYRDESEAKYAAMFERRAKRGQYFHHPYFGCREFPAEFRLIPDPEQEPVKIPDEFCNPMERDLGIMFFDWDYSNPDLKQLYYHPIMKKGVIEVPERESKEVIG